MAHPFGFATVETLGANRTLTAAEIASTNIFSFDPAAARDLTLPAEATSTGAVLFINNSANAAEAITVKDDAAATICVIAQDEAAVLWCDGVSWFGGAGSSA